MLSKSVQNVKKSSTGINTFLGINTTRSAKLGEFTDMKNMTGDYAPLLSPRKNYKCDINLEYGNITAIIKKNGAYYYIAGKTLYRKAGNGESNIMRFVKPAVFSKEKKDTDYNVSDLDNSSHFIEMGANVLIMPQQYYFNTSDIKDSNLFVVHKGKILENSQYSQYSQEHVLNLENGNGNQLVWNDLDRVASIEFKCVVPKRNNLEWGNIEYGYEKVFLKAEHYKDPATLDTKPEADTYWLDTKYQLHRYLAKTNSSYVVSDYRIKIFYKPANTSASWDYWRKDENPFPYNPFESLQKGDKLHFKAFGNMNSNHKYYHTNKNYIYDEIQSEKQLLLSNGSFDDFEDDGLVCMNTDKMSGRRWLDLDVTVENYSKIYKEETQYIFIVEPTQELLEALRKYDLLYYSLLYSKYNVKDMNKERVVVPTSFEINRIIPEDMNNYIEHNNRVWATRNSVNEVKACMQGNFKEWNTYNNLASDSYSASVGSDGAFTASGVIDDYLFFFKENSYSMVYGTKPSNFCVSTVKDFIGIRAEDKESVQTIGRAIYYLARNGRIYRFNGNTSECISDNFGDDRFCNGVATHSSGKYFINMTKVGTQDRALYCYDTATGLWHKYEDIGEKSLYNFGGNACLTESKANFTNIWQIEDSNLSDISASNIEPDFPWYAVTGRIGLELDYNMYVGNLKVMIECEKGTSVDIFIQYEHEKDWEKLSSYKSEKLGFFTDSIKLSRNKFFKLKISGKGRAWIYRILYEIEKGSDINGNF